MDEPLRRVEGERPLWGRGVTPEKRKAMLDAAAVAVILQDLRATRRSLGLAPAHVGD